MPRPPVVATSGRAVWPWCTHPRLVGSKPSAPRRLNVGHCGQANHRLATSAGEGPAGMGPAPHRPASGGPAPSLIDLPEKARCNIHSQRGRERPSDVHRHR